MQQDALALLYLQRIAKTQHPSIDRRIVIGGVHRSVATREQLAVPVMQRQEDLLVIVPRIFARLGHQKAVLPGILALLEIVPGRDMGVIPAKSGRTGRESVSSLARWRYHRRPLFHCAIDLRR